MKKLVVQVLLLVCAFALFAQNAPSVGLKDSDVKNFIKNYSKLEKELQKYGADLNNADSLKDVKAVDSVLEKNGISGPNRFKKIEAIANGSALVVAEKELKGMGIKAEDLLPEVANKLNKKDFEVIKKYSKELQTLFADISSYDDNDDDCDDFDYDDYAGLLGAYGYGDLSDSSGGYGSYGDLSALISNAEYLGSESGMNAFAKKAKENAEKAFKEEVAYLKSIEGKLKSSKKDIDFLYKKYDAKNAKKYKKVSIDKDVCEYGFNRDLTSQKNVDFPEGCFATLQFNEGGLWLRIGDGKKTDVIDGTIEVTDWEFYEGPNYAKEIVFKTKNAGTIHIWTNGGFNGSGVNAYLGNGGITVEGYYYQSAG